MPAQSTKPWYTPFLAAWAALKVYIDGGFALKSDVWHQHTATPPEPDPAPTATLPFNMLSTAELRASANKVWTHYMPGMVAKKSNTATDTYWDEAWASPPVGATGTNLYGYAGGYARQQPLITTVRSGVASCTLSGASASALDLFDGWQVKIMEDEVRQAIERGIDGFALLFQQSRGGDDPFQQFGPYWMMKAAGNVDAGFKCVITPDMSTSVGKLVNTLDVNDPANAVALAAEVAALAAFPAAYRLADGRLVVSSYNADMTAHNAAFWNAFADAMSANHNVDVALWPVANNVTEAVITSYSAANIPSMYGIGDWSDAAPSANVPGGTGATQPHNLAIKAQAAGLKYAVSVWVQFCRAWVGTAGAPLNGLAFESVNTKNLRDCFQIAREDVSEPGEWTIVNTWNDYMEGSVLAPTRVNGWFWLDLMAYYLTWYKTGTAPTILRDTIFLSHRKHPATGNTFSYANQTRFQTISGRQELVEVTVFLIDAGTLSVYVGAARAGVFSLPAGVSTVTVPLGTGTIAAAVVRSNAIVASVTSPVVVSTSQVVEDLTYIGATSLRNDGFNPDTSTPPGGWSTPNYTTTVASPAMDAHAIQGAQADTTFNTGSLSVRGTNGGTQMTAFLRFAVPANPTNQVISAAALRLVTIPTGASAVTGPFSVYLAATEIAWTDGNLTWNTNRPALGVLLGSVTGPLANSTTYTFTLTNAAALASFAGTTVTLCVANVADQGDAAEFHSMSSTGGSTVYPKLDLTYSTGVIDGTPPTAPTGVTASAVGTTVGLSWTISSDNVGVTGYRVHRSASAGFTPTGTTPGSGTCVGTPSTAAYSDTGVAAGTWYYQVEAVDLVGNISPASAQVSAVVTSAPTVQTIIASADAYVNSGAPTGNAGISGNLAAGTGSGYTVESLLRFAIPAAPGGQTIQSAVLKIRTTTSGSAGSATAQTVRELGSDAWVEGLGTTGQNGDNPAPGGGVVWTGRPVPSGAVLGTITAPANDTAYTVALDAATVAGFAGSTKSFHIANAGTPDTDVLWFWSHEHATAGYRPTLELTYA